MQKKLCHCITLLLILGFSPLAQSEEQFSQPDNHTYTELGAYLFATDITGDATLGPVSSDVDVSFEDIIENLELGAMAYVEHKRGNFVILADVAYVHLTSENTLAANGGATAILDAEAKQLILETYVGYRVLEKSLDEHSNYSLDLFLGARYNHVNLEVGIEAAGIGLPSSASRDRNESWIDPLIGMRAKYRINENWGVMGIADIGGFGVGSEITWQVGAFINYRLGENTRIYGGSRFLHFEYEKGSGANTFNFDADYIGPMIGLSYRF